MTKATKINDKLVIKDNDVFTETEFGEFTVLEISKLGYDCPRSKFETIPDKFIVESWDLNGYKFSAFVSNQIVCYDSALNPIGFLPVNDGKLASTIKDLKSGRLVMGCCTNSLYKN